MNWKELEERVREIASFRWNCNAVTETIAGVKCDCVLKPRADHWIIVEITKENSLSKMREDIAKLRTIRGALFQQEVYSSCYFVMENTPTDSMRAAGNEQKIIVKSTEEFQNEFFDYGSYIHIRNQRQFGSLINLETGEPENNEYVNVSYLNTYNNKELSIEDIVHLLKNGKKIILKGDYGLGKSRCIKQIFDSFILNPIENPYVVAVNLRDHWGAKRGKEILDRHFDDLGLDAKEFIKIYDRSNIVYLLDGFDEIGTQSWSSDKRKMQHIREMSVCALKDLITKVSGGVLVTGREYYFNSDKELARCLGIDMDKVIFLECHQEFTDSELLTFISKNVSEVLGSIKIEKLPAWLPKRPIVMQLLLKYAGDIFSMEHALDDICGFWYAFLCKICEREAKIYPALNPEVIKDVMIFLANQTRTSANNTGPITQEDISRAFTCVTGFTPSDESAIMLQRLPSIGRVSTDSPDRQFLDTFILNGLRAEGIIQFSKSWDSNVLAFDWVNPLDQTGLSILAEYIGKDAHRMDTFIGLARNASHATNKILASDIVSAICLLDKESIDFKDICISGGHFSYLSFEGKDICRLTITDSIIEKLDLTNTKFNPTIRIEKCILSEVYGISSRKSVPEQIIECEVDCFEMLATTTLIKRARLSESQKLYVEMIRKIFYQPGAGRKEAALLRGMGVSANKQLGGKILNRLLDEGLVTRIKGDEGYVYKPVRNKTGRIDKMLTDLTLSEDPVWLMISELS